MNKQNQLFEDLRLGIKDIVENPEVSDDIDWLYKKVEKIKMYIDVLKLHWKTFGQKFFVDFVSLLQEKSFLCSQIDKLLFPERQGEDDIEMFLTGAYSPHPHCTKQSNKFRKILKSTLKKVWLVVAADIFRISRVHFFDGPSALCQSLNPGCGELLFDLYFTEGVFGAGDVQETILHEISHALLEKVKFEEAEELAEGVSRYLMVYLNRKGRKNA